MRLYHGSTDIVQNPEIRNSINFLDFGPGFYTTTSYEQAERWAKIKMRRNNTNVGYVSVYDFDIDKASEVLNLKKFDTANEEWLLFVVNNRNGATPNNTYDMHIGPVADDNIYQTIRLFETGAFDAEYTVKRLKTEVLHDQWAFNSSESLSYLSFVEYKEIK